MKILELHLRNIASIEKADINFEKDAGLVDPDTGKAAQKFLIFGDTGTGKSVLLDGIAMALYGNTPRVKSVENRLRNTFTTSIGSEMSITSIEQYTRLGISEKDECYSEVVFLGNDGVTYRAKMQLGYRKSKGMLRSYRRWFLYEGDKDVLEGEQCGKAIENAVGMNFEQFNRMAMLAQGQFADFLCGGRKERSDILERLTNTRIFSVYGKAVHAIYDRKKGASTAAEKAYRTAEGFVFPDDVRQQYENQLQEADEKRSVASQRRKGLDFQIKLVTKILDGIERKTVSEKHLETLRSEMAGEEFVSLRNLCRDWDATEKERRSMDEMSAKRKALADALEREGELKSRCGLLMADLAERERVFLVESEKLKVELDWLEERKERDRLYSEATAVCSQMEQYQRNSAALEALHREKTGAEERVEPLAKELASAEKERADAAADVKTVQDAVDSVLKKIEELDPRKLDADIKNILQFKAAYEKLRADYETWIVKVESQKELESALSKLKEELESKKKNRNEVSERFATAQRAYEKAMRRLAAIDASLDEKLDELRQMIVNEHTDICPLCGQKIADTILTKEQFAQLVTPYEEERRHTKEEVEKVQAELNAATGAVGSAESRVKSQEEQLRKLTNEVEGGRDALATRMAKAGIDKTGDVDKAIADKLLQVADQEASLDKKRKMLSDLQEEMDAKLKGKKPLDDKLNAATDRLASVKGSVKHNADRISELAEKARKAKQDLEADSQQLEMRLALWFPGWQEHLDETVEQLKAESSEYLARKKSYLEADAMQARQRDLLNSINGIKDSIARQHSDWTAADVMPQLCSDPLKEWNEMSSLCSVVDNTLAECRKTIAACEDVLSQWRQHSGKDEKYLVDLVSRRDDVSSARKYVADIESNIKAWEKSLGDALAAIVEARKALGLADGDEVPDKVELERLYAEAEAGERDATELYTKAKTTLETNAMHQKKLDAAELEYKKAQKENDHWHLMDKYFGGENGDRFRNLVQTHILTPLLNNANHYLKRITNRYTLTCNSENEHLSILVLDRFNRNEVRSAAVLSGGEKFMISLALSLALSSLNRPDMNVNILFIDEGFGTLDQECLDSVMNTLSRLGEISGQSDRRVGIISHREELLGCIPNKIKLKKVGEGRSKVEIVYEP